MQRADYNDPILRLQRRIQALEEELQAVKRANNRPTIPIYSPQDLADIVETQRGEFWINSGDGSMYFQYGGTNKVTST